MGFIRDWVSLVLQIITLGTIFFTVFKVIDKNTREWEQREGRIVTIESDLKVLRTTREDLSKIDTKLSDLVSEISRVRDRLDRFLDKHV